MKQCVGVGMAVAAAIGSDEHATQHQGAALHESVHVVADADTKHSSLLSTLIRRFSICHLTFVICHCKNKLVIARARTATVVVNKYSPLPGK
jgi:hypothetical protein